MKKVILFCVVGLGLVFVSKAELVEIEGGYIVERYQIIDEAEIEYTKAGASGGVKICPGDGFLCSIQIGKDREGDPIYLSGFKGKGRQNVEVIN